MTVSSGAASPSYEVHPDSGARSVEKEPVPDLCPVNRDSKSIFLGKSNSKQSDDPSTTLPEKGGDNEAAAALTFWQSLYAVCVPFLYQLLLDTSLAVQSIPVAYGYDALYNSMDWMNTKLYRTLMMPHWLETGSKSLPPWPLVFLAVLTITALIAHPDGFTWILYRRIRTSIVYLLDSSTTCWAWVLNDFGSVVSTILALTTFVSLFFFCYVLHRTLKSRGTTKESTPKGTSASATPEKSRRKRRKAKNDKHRSDQQSVRRDKSVPSDLPSTQSPSPVKSPAKSNESKPSSQEPLLPTSNEQVQLPATESNRNRPRVQMEPPVVPDTPPVDTRLEHVSGRAAAREQLGVSIPRSASTRNSRTPRKHAVQSSQNPTFLPDKRGSPSKSANVDRSAVSSRWDALKPTKEESTSTDGRRSRRDDKLYLQKSPPGLARVEKRPTPTEKRTTHGKHSTGVPGLGSVKPRRSSPRPVLAESLWPESASMQTSTNAPKQADTMDDISSGARASEAAHGSALNPNSLSFAPSRTPGLRPPPGLTLPSYVGNLDSNRPVEPLFPPPATPPPEEATSVPWLTLPSGCTSPSLLRPRDNPFEDDEEEQIAAELQELGGQMAGSILD